MSKRQRMEDVPVTERKFVYLLGFDNLFQPLYADLTLLRYYDCRTAKSIDHGDAPYYVESDNVPVYKSWMTRSMLVCFLKSLTLGKMCVGEGVAYREACELFDYEGICVPSAKDAEEVAKLSQQAIKDGYGMGIGMNKRKESLMETTSRHCEAIANAILEWPRLEHGLESAFSTEEVDVGERTPVAFSCTPTRCWVRFVQPPEKGLVEACTDPTYSICKRRPFWLAATLYAIGSAHSKLVAIKKVQPDDYSESAFFALEDGIKHDPSAGFASTRVDVPRAWRDRARRSLGDAELFAINVLNEVVSHGALVTRTELKSDKISVKCKFSRATVALAIKMASKTPRIATMFAAGCEDDKGTTPERAALSKALKAHGIRVIKWGHEVNALVFPPSMRVVDTKADGPCVLLGFENMR